MIDEPSGASVYTDFRGLAQLRAAAGKQSPEALRETARQFEALFVQSMLKAMRDASPGDGLFDSDQTKFYRDIYDRQLALEMVKGRGIGIAKMLVRNLGGEAGQAAGQQPPSRPVLPAVEADAAVPTAPLVAVDSTPQALLDINVQASPLVELAGMNVRRRPAAGMPRDWRPENREAFVRELMPYAEKGAAQLGVHPGVIVAQAALETGWGQKIIRHPDGRSSYNLFGIKADERWTGERVSVPTLEFEDGVAVKKRAAFRSYESLDEAVSGYIDFLRSNPRYRQALDRAGDTDAFLEGLESAGYATDPRYAEKIRAIMRGDPFDQQQDRLARTVDLAGS